MSDTPSIGNPNALVGSPAAAQARAIFEQQRPATSIDSTHVVAGDIDDDDDDDFEETVDVNSLHNEDAE